MKNIIAALVVALTVLSLGSCGSNTSNGGANSNNGNGAASNGTNGVESMVGEMGGALRGRSNDMWKDGEVSDRADNANDMWHGGAISDRPGDATRDRERTPYMR